VQSSDRDGVRGMSHVASDERRRTIVTAAGAGRAFWSIVFEMCMDA
jgi:hypothetical protein